MAYPFYKPTSQSSALTAKTTIIIKVTSAIIVPKMNPNSSTVLFRRFIFTPLLLRPSSLRIILRCPPG